MFSFVLEKIKNKKNLRTIFKDKYLSEINSKCLLASQITKKQKQKKKKKTTKTNRGHVK